MNAVTRVLIVDDSALVRKMLKIAFSKFNDIEVVGEAEDAYAARDILITVKPDVMTLDIEMPKMDGVTFLKKIIPSMPIPTIVFSSYTAKTAKISLEALEAGAVDVMEKPKFDLKNGIDANVVQEFHDKIIQAKEAKIQAHARSVVEYLSDDKNQCGFDEEMTDIYSEKIIVIGSSTGGVEALSQILPQFPKNSPPIVIVQHMPKLFTASFATRLNNMCQVKVKESGHNEKLTPGQVLIAPGGEAHLKIVKKGTFFYTELFEGEKVMHNRPSIDVMFKSISEYSEDRVAAVLMTGMGKDGASGLLDIKKLGGRTFTQDEDSSVIYGMAKAAVQLNASEKELSLNTIPKELLDTFK